MLQGQAELQASRRRRPSAHQDAPAYRFVDVHVSRMVAIDDAAESNGCLEVVSGAHDRLWPTDDAGCIRADVVDSMAWQPVPVAPAMRCGSTPGTPHRSGPNPSSRPAGLVPDVQRPVGGDLREDYYRQKADELAAASPAGDRVAVSLIGDFQGRPVR